MAPPRYALAKSIELGATLTALVTDNGGTLRTATIASAGRFVRARLASGSATGTTTSDPYELLSRAASQLSAGAGAGTWAVVQTSDGRVRVTWSGPGAGTIFAGDLTRALGFTGGISLAAGASTTSTYPPAGMLLWLLTENDSDWTPTANGASARDSAGRVYARGAAYVDWTRTMTAFWVPRSWNDNPSGDYLSPAWWGEIAYAGTSAPTAPDLTIARPEAWFDALFSVDGEVAFGFTDELSSLATNAPVSTVYVTPAILEEQRFLLPERAPTYRPRRSITIELSRTGTLEIA
jgi:hypothetical protein